MKFNNKYSDILWSGGEGDAKKKRKILFYLKGTVGVYDWVTKLIFTHVLSRKKDTWPLIKFLYILIRDFIKQKFEGLKAILEIYKSL